MSPTNPPTSHETYFDKFSSPSEAERYSRSLAGTKTHQREERCVRRLLAGVPRGGRVLDLPCGAARLLPALLDMGYQVTEADASPAMIDQAKLYADRRQLPCDEVQFVVADALDTGFKDHEFDAIVCNRLFHHFRESEIRRQALVEFKRICRGPIIVSFFCNIAWDSAVFHVRNALRRKKATDRIPICYTVFSRDIKAAGLSIARIKPTRPGISKQWYLVLK